MYLFQIICIQLYGRLVEIHFIIFVIFTIHWNLCLLSTRISSRLIQQEKHKWSFTKRYIILCTYEYFRVKIKFELWLTGQQCYEENRTCIYCMLCIIRNDSLLKFLLPCLHDLKLVEIITVQSDETYSITYF